MNGHSLEWYARRLAQSKYKYPIIAVPFLLCFLIIFTTMSSNTMNEIVPENEAYKINKVEQFDNSINRREFETKDSQPTFTRQKEWKKEQEDNEINKILERQKQQINEELKEKQTDGTNDEKKGSLHKDSDEDKKREEYEDEKEKESGNDMINAPSMPMPEIIQEIPSSLLGNYPILADNSSTILSNDTSLLSNFSTDINDNSTLIEETNSTLSTLKLEDILHKTAELQTLLATNISEIPTNTTMDSLLAPVQVFPQIRLDPTSQRPMQNSAISSNTTINLPIVINNEEVELKVEKSESSNNHMILDFGDNGQPEIPENERISVLEGQVEDDNRNDPDVVKMVL